MKIINLVENTPGHPGCAFEHGLSFYIETANHRILMDTGATGAFASNARLLGISLEKVDAVILSHGHYDHGGGLLTFHEINACAPVYLQRGASGAYYHEKEDGPHYIGLDPSVLTFPQCVLLDGDTRIDRELFLFTGIRGRKFWPEGNRELKREEDGCFLQDDFSHEQCLVVEEDGLRVLLSGCAHSGIWNILDRYRELYGSDPDLLISGFHMKRTNYREEDLEQIRQTARMLQKTDILCYTGHCTGPVAFAVMKEIMGEQLQAVHSGEEILPDGRRNL